MPILLWDFVSINCIMICLIIPFPNITNIICISKKPLEYHSSNGAYNISYGNDHILYRDIKTLRY